MPSLGPSLPLAFQLWLSPPLAGHGPIRSWLALLWYSLSPLFCERPGSALGWSFLRESSLFFFLSLAIPQLGFPGGSGVKASVCNVGDPGSIPG